jgi:hypothetical protein
MEKEFVTYELALKMKQLGYKKEGVDEDCFAFYDEEEYLFTVREQDDIDEEWLIAPTFSQAFRWFREKYGLCILIKPIDDKKLELGYNLTKNGLIMSAHLTYEKAELACLKKLIKIVEENELNKQSN